MSPARIIPKIQGEVLKIKKTGDKIKDDDGNEWEKCVFTVKVTGFSKRKAHKKIRPELEGKKVKLVRYCCFDWHYKTGIKKTLEFDETEALLTGQNPFSSNLLG